MGGVTLPALVMEPVCGFCNVQPVALPIGGPYIIAVSRGIGQRCSREIETEQILYVPI